MDKELVTINVFADPTDANISKGKLEAEGIKCFLKNETMTGSTGLHVTYGGIELVVAEQDSAKAKSILEIPSS